jgi:tetratricopeptide (TPR) repeat protein
VSRKYLTNISLLAIFAFLFPLMISAASAKFHVDVGLNHFYKKRFLEAYREFKTALDIDPKYAEAHFNLGRVYKAQGFIKEALIEFQIALKLNPSYLAAKREFEALKSSLEEDVRTQLKIQGQETLDKTRFEPIPAAEAEKKAKQLLNQGRTAEAIRYFEQALRQKPDDVALNKMLGFLYFRQNSFTNSLERYSKAMDLLPVDPEIPYAIGLIHMKTKFPEKAEGFFRQALRLQPEMVKAVFALGEALEAQDKIEDAIFQFRKCLELSPKLEEAQNKLSYLVTRLSYNYFSRGSYYYQRGEYDRAESMLSLARNYGNLSDEQNRQVDEMLNASRYWINKKRAQAKINSEYESISKSSYLNKEIEVYDVAQNFKPYIGQPVIWSGRVEFVGERKGKKYLFVNSRPEINLDNGMENAFEIEFPKDLPNDPRIALGSEVVEVKGKVLRVDKIRDQISGAFSTRRQPVIEATEIEITRKNYDQPLILRFY